MQEQVAVSGKSGHCLPPPSCLLNNLGFLIERKEKEIPRTGFVGMEKKPQLGLLTVCAKCLEVNPRLCAKSRRSVRTCHFA